MALETGTYPSDFVLTNPTSGDQKTQGDDHLRLIKACVQAALPIGAPNYPLTSGTAQASTSGTSIDFTSIPSWVKRITVSFVGVSTSGTSNVQVQIGDSGGVETTGYLGSVSQIAASTPSSATLNSGFPVTLGIAAASVIHGSVVLSLVNAATFTWASTSTISYSNTAQTNVGAGSKSLTATLDRVRITTTGGAETFDAGSINILYE